MLIFENALIVALIGALIVLHILSFVFTKVISRIITYINITLHIVLFALLLFKNIPIEETVLVFMASLLSYVLSAFIYYKIKGDGKA